MSKDQSLLLQTTCGQNDAGLHLLPRFSFDAPFRLSLSGSPCLPSSAALSKNQVAKAGDSARSETARCSAAKLTRGTVIFCGIRSFLSIGPLLGCRRLARAEVAGKGPKLPLLASKWCSAHSGVAFSSFFAARSGVSDLYPRPPAAAYIQTLVATAQDAAEEEGRRTRRRGRWRRCRSSEDHGG